MSCLDGVANLPHEVEGHRLRRALDKAVEATLEQHAARLAQSVAQDLKALEAEGRLDVGREGPP